MSTLEIKSLRKSYGSVDVLHDINFRAEDGEFVVLVGPSGCGKSTLLRSIAGLETTNGGSILIDGKDVTQLPPKDRDIAMVFQSYALYPHMSVRQNIEFGLKIAGMEKSTRDARIEEVAEMLELTPLLDRFPKQLSGGQRQRVAIGRAISRRPKVFLFDEPLSNLDAALRGQMRVEIAKLQEQLGVTTVYVTHDQLEAMTLADRVVILDGGRVQQIGAPDALYSTPENVFVGRFLGTPSMNLIEVDVQSSDGAYQLSNSDGLRLRVECDAQLGSRARLGIRPEHLLPVGSGVPLFDATVELVENLGHEQHVHLTTAQKLRIISRVPSAEAELRAGDTISLSSAEENVHVFDAEGRRVDARLASARARAVSP